MALGKFANRIVGSGEEPLDQIQFNPRNWRVHPLNQQNALKGVLEEVGWVQEVIINQRTGHLVDGHLRCQLAAREGAKTIPVKYVDLSEEEEALVLSTLDPIAAMATTDREKLNELFESINSDNENVQKLISEIAEKEGLYKPAKPEGKPNPRILPLDVIFSIISPPRCCVAVDAGLLVGGQSSKALLKADGGCPVGHKISFIDNDYFNYNHELHLACVKQHRPKYATVADVMSKEQCEQNGANFYSLEQIMDWAEELREYADNVIVIPKIDVLDKIPDYFMVGYSIPTKHGGTTLPVEMFKGKKLHLLGGSWTDQLAHLLLFGEDVISLDNNYENHRAEYGQYTDPDGKYWNIDSTLQWGRTNGLMSCLVLGLGAIGAKVNELYGGNGKPAELEKTDE